MICISVVPAANAEALSLLGRALPLAELVELRIDRIEDPALPMLLHAGRERIVVTNRRRDEGGFFASCETRRLDLLLESVELGARLVDIEARTGGKAVGRLADAVRSHGGKTRLIVSHHDLAGTPSAKALTARLKACRALGADVVKLVTLANSADDDLRVRGRRDVRAGGWAHRAPHSVLHPRGRASSPRATLRFHTCRLARRCLPAARIPATRSVGDKVYGGLTVLAEFDPQQA